MESNNESKVYELSWYINPHLFWLRTPTLSHDDLKLEMKLNQRYKNFAEFQHFKFSPEVGELVAYYNHLTGSWYRAVVDYHCNYLDKNQNDYIIWLIDYGYALHVTSTYLRKLDPNFTARKLSEPVLKVGVAHVLPVTEDYDYLHECSIVQKADNWDPYTVRTFKRVLENAGSIKFKTHYLANGHYFGEVIILDASGRKTNAMELLVNMGRAMETPGTAAFMDELIKIETLNVERYQDNDRRNIPPKQNIISQQQLRRRQKIEQEHQKNNEKTIQLLRHMKEVDIVEAFEEDTINQIPKNIPNEMHPFHKVAKWLEKYVVLPTETKKKGNDAKEDHIPMLVARESFKLKETPRVPAPLRKFSTHNIIRPQKIQLDTTDNKSEVNLSIVRPKTTDSHPIPVKKSTFGQSILKKLEEARIKRENSQKEMMNCLDTKKGTTVTVTMKPKRQLNFFPADYFEVKAQEERSSRFRGSASVYTMRSFTSDKTRQNRYFPADFKHQQDTVVEQDEE